MNTWRVAQGTDASYQVTICDDQGAIITSYAGSEALTGIVWPGGDQAQTFALTLAWNNAGAGAIDVLVTAASTQALGPGTYRVQLSLIDSGGKDRDFYEGVLEVFTSPLAVVQVRTGTILLNTYAVNGISSTDGLEVGWQVAGTGIPSEAVIQQVSSATSLLLSLPATTSGLTSLTITPAPAPVYCTYEDMLELAPWIGDLQSVLQDETGFAKQRAHARQKLDQCILLSYRGHTVGQFGTHSDLAYGWGYGGGKRRSVLTSPTIRQWLDSNFLIVRDAITRTCAHWAIADVCLAQMGRGGHYVSYGAWHRREGDKLASCTTVEMDINGDGLAEIGVPLGSTNTLFT